MHVETFFLPAQQTATVTASTAAVQCCIFTAGINHFMAQMQHIIRNGSLCWASLDHKGGSSCTQRGGGTYTTYRHSTNSVHRERSIRNGKQNWYLAKVEAMDKTRGQRCNYSLPMIYCITCSWGRWRWKYSHVPFVEGCARKLRTVLAWKSMDMK